MDMTEHTAHEGELLNLAANHLKSAQGDKPLEAQHLHVTAAVASTALAAELRARREATNGHSPAPTRVPKSKFFVCHLCEWGTQQPC